LISPLGRGRGEAEGVRWSKMRKFLLFAVIAFGFFMYSVRTLLGGAAGFDYKVAPRIITPSRSAGQNDRFFIFYKNTENRPSGSIFNIMGMKVGDFKNEGGEGSQSFDDPDAPGGGKEWEGRLYWEAGGVPAGIYIWQFSAEGNFYTGAVVVAR